MSRIYRYVTSSLCIVGLASSAVGCGSSQQQCRPALPAISGDAATNLTGNVSGGVTAGANAGVDASADAAASARAKVPPTDAELRQAAELRARAKAQIDVGKWREALPDLERAFVLSGDVTMLGDLGFSLDAAGRFDEAWAAFFRFRAEARAAYEPIKAKVDAKLGELQAKLGGLQIDTDAPGAEVIIRGQVVARLPLATPIYLAPGDAAVVVRVPGKPDYTLRSRVAVGAVARARANLADIGAGAVGVVGGVTTGVGGALGGVGGTLGGVGGGLGLGRPTGNVSAPSGNVGAVGGVTGAVGGVTGTVGGVTGGLGAPALTPPVPPAPPVWPIVVGVGGVVVVGGAIAASVVHKGRLDNFDAKLCGKAGASPECPAIDASLGTTKGLQVAGYLLGGIALTTGIVVFAVTRSVPDCPKVGQSAPLRMSCGVGADGTGAGMSCVGAF